jgi:chaperonin cofactor prefoldin
MLAHTRKKELLGHLHKQVRTLQVKRNCLIEECQKQKMRLDELRSKAAQKKG